LTILFAFSKDGHTTLSDWFLPFQTKLSKNDSGTKPKAGCERSTFRSQL
jgi:hypothetical protein